MPISSISVGDIARVGPGMDAAEVELFLYADEIRKSDVRIRSTIRQVQLGSKLRESIGEHVDRLRELRGVLTSLLDEKGKIKKGLAWLTIRNHWQDSKTVDWFMNVKSGYEFRINPKTSEIETREGAKSLWKEGKTLDTLDAEIQRLQDQLGQLDSDREITLLRMGQETNSKHRMLTQVTNLLKARNDAAMMILANLRTR